MFFRRNKITSNDNSPPAVEAPSIIGVDTVVDGIITTRGEIHVEGTVRGTIDASVCIVGPDGLVEGNVVAEEVIVRGRVTGPIHGIHVDLQAGAHLEGDVVSTSITVQNGAHIQGSIWHSDDPLTARNGSGRYAAPSPASYLGSPQLATGADDGFRPLKVIKPR
jgi:cytoskeletal protein CcmA (bactofilin family)